MHPLELRAGDQLRNEARGLVQLDFDEVSEAPEAVAEGEGDRVDLAPIQGGLEVELLQPSTTGDAFELAVRASLKRAEGGSSGG